MAADAGRRLHDVHPAQLSSSAIDPSTMAPKGTVLSPETAKDISAGVRVPFTQIAPTVLKVQWLAARGAALQPHTSSAMQVLCMGACRGACALQPVHPGLHA